MDKVVAAVVGGVVGFFLGEVLAALLGLPLNVLLDADVPMAVRLTPFYCAAAGVVIGPSLLGRRS